MFKKKIYVTKPSNVRHLSLQPENLCRLNFLLSMLYFVYLHKAFFCVFSNVFISAIITGSSVINYLCSKNSLLIVYMFVLNVQNLYVPIALSIHSLFIPMAITVRKV